MAKKIIFGFFILLFSVNTFSQEIKWLSIEEAVELNKTNPKKFIIDVYTDWCHWCKVMDKETFQHPEVAKYITENFYAVRLDGEGKKTINFLDREFKWIDNGRNGYHELAAALLNGKLSYPSIVYLTEDLKMLTVVPGYTKAPDIEPILHFFAEDLYINTKWEDFRAGFKGKI